MFDANKSQREIPLLLVGPSADPYVEKPT